MQVEFGVAAALVSMRIEIATHIEALQPFKNPTNFKSEFFQLTIFFEPVGVYGSERVSW